MTILGCLQQGREVYPAPHVVPYCNRGMNMCARQNVTGKENTAVPQSPGYPAQAQNLTFLPNNSLI